MAAGDLSAQDEILQVLFWMRGEGLGEAAPAEAINRMVRLAEPELERVLDQLRARGLVEVLPAAGGPVRYGLTPAGVEEGRKRFADEFTPYLGKESHLECSDPSCDCHQPGWAGDCVTATR
jgi:hypothetical protein